MTIRALAWFLVVAATSGVAPAVFADDDELMVLVEVGLKERGKSRPPALFFLSYGEESQRSIGEKEVIRVKVSRKAGRLKVEVSYKRGTELLYDPIVDFVERKAQVVTLQDKLAHRALTIKVQPAHHGSRLTFNFRNADVEDVIDMIARVAGVKIIVDPQVRGQITLSINAVPWSKVLDSVVKTLGFKLIMRKDGVLIVTQPR